MEVIQSIMAMRFRPDPEALKQMLEPAKALAGADITDDGGWATCWAVETLLPEVEDPLAGHFFELAVGAPCLYKGEPSTFFPYIWLERVYLAMLTGLERGVADISVSQFHRLCRGREGPGKGTRLQALASRYGEALVRAEMVLEQPAGWADLGTGFLRWLNIFHMIDPLRPGENLLHALSLAEVAPEPRLGPVWRGRATLQFGPADSGLLTALAPREMGPAFYTSVAYNYASDQRLAG